MKDVRPTSGKVLQALFNILGDIDGSKFLDLFAGTGHVGLEALKRGAESCVFVENVKNRADAIKKLSSDSLVLSLEVRRAVSWIVKREMKFNIIFADPPYNSGWCEEILKIPNLEKLFNNDCVFILEHSSREKFEINNEIFELISMREYGETCLTFLKKIIRI
ncbi:MAG: 16S rRNA (guanine(966)-N(2))-methyltransferase RsmD [Synergistaceae bacterium]|nr:16S rRNA (guanine(966)-N(2))-methyltransferase RsmD [Synergistaceae bacterium]